MTKEEKNEYYRNYRKTESGKLVIARAEDKWNSVALGVI
jgi:hypothetical protein